ncbi:hypothetical protein BUALT_Bualt10G0079800 [Buddleja alternifolia]|uniref:F-box domain-containing protein n=1 Tax=Buddleja alternifolia TaxID=168488 RepID=A0AAV6X474_9LAMI|nr:hypothetical protein BUALT_Bualt10G0079800 [Buddleja alternifolia]
MVSPSGIMDIPTAILLEIFLKLPVYAITRCKSVCKSWFNLLVSTDPYFANVYTRNPPFTTLVLSEEGGSRTPGNLSTSFFLLEISEDGNNYIRTRLEPRVPDCLDAKSDLFLSGSSKGFLCLCESKYIAWFMVQTVYISNPITGECIALPPHRVSCRDRETTIIQHKFDFSPSTDNFKVMRFVYTRLHSVNDKVHVEIFTVGVDDHWRCLKEHSIPSSLWSGGFIFNGAYHWIKIVYKKIELICTFDLGKEKEGRVINLPPLLENLSEATITSFNNRFSLVIRSAQSHITIWTMTEYGVDSSWTKDVILQSWFPSHLCFEEHFPVAILRNGAIIFKRWGKNCLFCCDTKKKKTATIKLQADVGAERFKPISNFVKNYAPSFSSLKELMMGGEGSSVNAKSK